MSQFVQAQIENNIFTVTLNRIDRKNAINLEMYNSLSDRVEEADASPDVKVVLLTGAGGCFTSGNDLADFANATELNSPDNPIMRFLMAFARCSKPIVVAVDGLAVGIGTTLLLHADLVVAGEDAKFRLPFANLGLCPEYASSLLLPRLAGHVKACEWLMLGEFFSAQEALQAGLINQCHDQPLACAKGMAEKLVKQPPAALRATKRLLKLASQTQLEATIQEEIAAFSEALKGAEFAEAVGAFFEKRKPDFSKFV